ncbi:MAG: S-layer homology domain-containing protein [Thermoclostridium sp.]|nr:S-layer homology domain-containing protein [Thermoclostridium sp.]
MKRLLAFLVAAVLLILGGSVGSTGLEQNGEVDLPSSWAISGLEDLKGKINLDQQFYSRYRENITRADFSYLAVKLYEALSNKVIDLSTAETGVFLDSSDQYVNMAYKLEIIKGYGNGLFGPDDEITREQIAVMLVKTIEKAGFPLDRTGIATLNFNDHQSISSWALEQVRLCYLNNIVKGTGNMTIDPKTFTTREQALLLTGRVINEKGSLKLVKASTGYHFSLKWDKGGAYKSWAETGWYSKPALGDINADGKKELVCSAYSIVALNPDNGSLIWRAPSGHEAGDDSSSVGRTWPDIIIKDIDKDGKSEIITAHGEGVVSVYGANGNFKPGWPQKPSDSELRGLKVEDIDLDGDCEIIVSAAIGSKTNTWVLSHRGELVEGWPQLSDESGYAWGVYNNNASVGNINADDRLEIVIPSDVHYICAYDAAGKAIQANPMYGNKAWGKVGVWEDLQVELRGWGECSGPRAEKYRPNFASGGSVIADVDNDGVNEVIVTGNVYDCENQYISKYIGPFIFNGDRSRYKNSKYNWESAPIDSGLPLEEDYSVIENIQPNPKVVDLDGNGEKEILYSSYDGRIHCYWLDKQEHHNWPYEVSSPDKSYIEFSSMPEVEDIDQDGIMEIIVSTWTDKQSGINGRLLLLDHKGNLLAQIQLPDSFDKGQGNGGLACPLVEDIDGDGLLEVVVNSVNSGFIAYDIQRN